MSYIPSHSHYYNHTKQCRNSKQITQSSNITILIIPNIVYNIITTKIASYLPMISVLLLLTLYISFINADVCLLFICVYSVRLSTKYTQFYSPNSDVQINLMSNTTLFNNNTLSASQSMITESYSTNDYWHR